MVIRSAGNASLLETSSRFTQRCLLLGLFTSHGDYVSYFTSHGDYVSYACTSSSTEEVNPSSKSTFLFTMPDSVLINRQVHVPETLMHFGEWGGSKTGLGTPEECLFGCLFVVYENFSNFFEPPWGCVPEWAIYDGSGIYHLHWWKFHLSIPLVVFSLHVFYSV